MQSRINKILLTFFGIFTFLFFREDIVNYIIDFSKSRNHMIFIVFYLSVIVLVLTLILYFDRKKIINNLKNEIKTDVLTQISNRDGFDNKILKIIEKKDSSFAIAIIDLDYFKDINDNMGHDVGDHYLVKISNEIKNSLSECDFIARLGGDEFVVVISGFNNLFELKTKLRKIHSSIKKTHYLINDKKISGSASIGVAISTGVESKEDLMKQADIAMYKSKKRGKNQFTFFNKNLRKERERINFIKEEMKLAILNNDFEIYYQPIVNKETNKTEGLEALVRWNHKELGYVSPSEFIYIAEKYNIIYDLGDLIMEDVLENIRDWKSSGILDSYISINISPKQLIKNGFVESLINKLESKNIATSDIQIEVTETSLIKNLDRAKRVIDNLKNKGVRIALDDFGDGYSSLSYLVNFKFDAIKLDKNFIKNIENDNIKLSIIKNIANIANDIGSEFILEGIESEEHLERVKETGFTHMQGYLIGKPRNNKTIEYFLLKESKNKS